LINRFLETEIDYFQLPGTAKASSALAVSGKFGLVHRFKQSGSPMAIQIVMDRTGDTRHEFDAGDRAAIEKAEKRFNELTGDGFTAAVRSGPGEQRVIRSFDPKAEETLFYPRLVGG
jgi:hypothetical protein